MYAQGFCAFETTSQSFPPSFEVFHAVYFQRPYRTKLNISGVFPTTLQNKAEHFSETVRTEFFSMKSLSSAEQFGVYASDFLKRCCDSLSQLLSEVQEKQCTTVLIVLIVLIDSRTLLTSQQDLTERAIEVFKNIGRARAAKVLGVDLAQFYL